MSTPPFITPPQPVSNSQEKAFSSSATYSTGDAVSFEGSPPSPPASHSTEKEFGPSTTYSAGDAVSFEGFNYVCTTACVGQTPTNSGFWNRTGPNKA